MLSKFSTWCQGCAVLLEKLNKLPTDELASMRDVHFEKVHGISMKSVDALT